MNHKCEAPEWSPFRAYGAAIEHCYEDNNGVFWVSNGEYASQVNFCPYCGAEAPVQLGPDNPTPYRVEVVWKRPTAAVPPPEPEQTVRHGQSPIKVVETRSEHQQ